MRVTAYDADGAVLHEWSVPDVLPPPGTLNLLGGDDVQERAHRIVREDGYVLKDRSGPKGWVGGSKL